MSYGLFQIYNKIGTLVGRRSSKTVTPEMLQDKLDDLQSKVLSEEDYTEDQWAIWEQAVEEVESVLAIEEPDKTSLRNAYNGLISAYSQMSETDDSELLDYLVYVNSNAGSETSYTPESWEEFSITRTTANAVLNNPDKTQKHIDIALENLIIGFEGLDTRADKSGLNIVISQIIEEVEPEENYKPSTWEPFSEAMSHALYISGNPDASQEDADQAEENLESTYGTLVKRANKVTLNNTLQEISENIGDESIYTPSTWSVFYPIYVTALEVYNDPEVDQPEVDSINTNVNTSYLGLNLRANKTALVNILNTVSANVGPETDYIPNSWTGFPVALSVANTVNNNLNASQSEVDSAVSNLQSAYGNLVKKADKNLLSGLLSTISSADPQEIDYTPSSWAPFSSALTTGASVNSDDNATQGQVDGAYYALSSAYSGLVLKANKTTLGETITIVTSTAVNEGDYTPSTWGPYSSALNTAQSIYSDDEATQNQVNTANSNLMSAFNDLVELADKSDLVILLNSINSSVGEEEEYTPATWGLFEPALSSAESVYADPDATQQNVNDAFSALQAAFIGLELIPDKTSLIDLIESVATEVGPEGDYTPETWGAFSLALQAAEALVDDVNATQDQVTTAYNDLDDAFGSLESV